MIRNRKQLELTRREMERLKARLADLRTKALSRGLRQLQEASLVRMVQDLEAQAQAYREAERGRVRATVLERLLSPRESGDRPRVGEAMFLLRLAKGMTQEELARKLETRREVVARWERDDYVGYTLQNLQKIFEALGFRLGLFIRIAG